jgi:hypothetical protein
MRVRIKWGYITEGALIDFLKQGFFLQRTPHRPDSLWLRNPKYYPRASFDFSLYVIDDIPDKKIAEFLNTSKEFERRSEAPHRMSRN